MYYILNDIHDFPSFGHASRSCRMAWSRPLASSYAWLRVHRKKEAFQDYQTVEAVGKTQNNQIDSYQYCILVVLQ